MHPEPFGRLGLFMSSFPLSNEGIVKLWHWGDGHNADRWQQIWTALAINARVVEEVAERNRREGCFGQRVGRRDDWPVTQHADD